MKNPTFKFEKELISEGYFGIVGIDEVGYGAVAGPVVTAAVMLPLDSRLSEVRDSKLLSEKKREELYVKILEKCHGVAIGSATPREVDQLNVRQATYLAMRRAISQIPSIDFVLVDAWTIPELQIPQKGINSGDKLVKSIAAASIIAKVYRDRLMKKYGEEFPEYGFEKHKGYGTKIHLEAIKTYGPCPIHRVSYKIF